MKNLMKLSIVALLVTIGTASYAQIFGVKAGLNLSNFLIKNDNFHNDTKMNPGFHFGPTIEIPIDEMFSFESGLLLSTKGMKISEKENYMGSSIEFIQKVNLYYLDIPLTAKATFDIGGSKIYGTFGPYVGMGLSGKSKTEYTQNGENRTTEEEINFGSNEGEDNFMRLDYGLTAGAGIELKSIQIGISYNLGLANIINYSDNENTIKNRVLGVSVGYKFGGK